MKLPRWLVIAMLTSSGLAVLAAAGWWWVTLPERSAREFYELMRDGHFSEAAKMIDPPPSGGDIDFVEDSAPTSEWQSVMRTARLELEDRDLAEYLLGRQRFRVTFTRHGRDNFDVFIVQRGRVITDYDVLF
jgi:hypothetical protein